MYIDTPNEILTAEPGMTILSKDCKSKGFERLIALSYRELNAVPGMATDAMLHRARHVSELIHPTK